MSSLVQELDGEVVHVWHAALDPGNEGASWLSSEERDRAARLVSPVDRALFTAARAALRNVLAEYCDVPPATLRFEYGEKGKPRLEWPHAGLEFNLSHAGDRALIAVTRAGPVGVDIERCDRKVDVEMVSQRFFAPEEVHVLHSLSGPARHQAFLRCWTRKEAYIKASAKGLWLPLHAIVVSVAPEEPARLVASREDPESVGAWVMRDVDVGCDHLASLVLRAVDATIVDKGWISE